MVITLFQRSVGYFIYEFVNLFPLLKEKQIPLSISKSLKFMKIVVDFLFRKLFFPQNKILPGDLFFSNWFF